MSAWCGDCLTAFCESYIDVVGSYFVEGDYVIQCAPVLEGNPFECVLYLTGEM